MKNVIKKITKVICVIILIFCFALTVYLLTSNDAREAFKKGQEDAEKGVYEPPSLVLKIDGEKG